jgi:hypothetical protein
MCGTWRQVFRRSNIYWLYNHARRIYQSIDLLKAYPERITDNKRPDPAGLMNKQTPWWLILTGLGRSVRSRYCPDSQTELRARTGRR